MHTSRNVKLALMQCDRFLKNASLGPRRAVGVDMLAEIAAAVSVLASVMGIRGHESFEHETCIRYILGNMSGESPPVNAFRRLRNAVLRKLHGWDDSPTTVHRVHLRQQTFLSFLM
jgi:hypothetical protein